MRLSAFFALPLLLAGVTGAIPTPQVSKRAISGSPQGSSCGNTDFNDFQIEDAAQRGVNNRNGPNPGGYPKEFGNTEGFEFGNCDGQMYEFPILKSGNVYGGGRPFEFRVIYQLADDGDGKYCGLVYHPPNDDRGFEHCKDVSG
ncbi:hypothetical protein N7491_002002 [Penicillium cf. griseofulvum]|uniref:ribonuclease T1 n=1 Tax=Penicillium cf. griseofulvum TaxID=2972120 RepID=A0A9W9T3K1_9EURO|nr:hypothetical protein N7472_003813 [Penicillium cf. griseofulvum]KAJ5445920.1 hypothetical protein N7491_002002 [Penicillium cf. griseofulvum]KAJ5447643.1 hypothetical protein N7445_002464 [Penicillium cf. griseofulvum]